MLYSKRTVSVLICICLMFVNEGCSGTSGNDILYTESISVDEGQENREAGSVEQEKQRIYVDVCGQVRNPGVYELPEGSRVFDAIAMAGGTTDQAASKVVNRAERLQDGQQLYIPSEEECTDSSAVVPETDGKINLNTATEEELTTLTGIGPSRAKAILLYREKNGSFRSVEELTNVEGIKEGIFSKIKDLITV